LRVAFAGTPPFAASALEAIAAGGHEIVLVVSQPDRPSGRGLKLTPSAVSKCALEHGFALFRPATLKEPEAARRIREARPEVLVVAAYGLILPQAILDIPPRGCLNIHASLLPRWRGAAPIQRAILAGDAETGVGIMRMEAGLDTGPVLLEKRTAIGSRENASALTARLADLGAGAIVEALAQLDRLAPRSQDEALATYAPKVERSEARIDWTRTSAEIDRRIRAFNPAPGAETLFGGEILKVWEGLPLHAEGLPGSVIGTHEGCPVVACGGGALALTLVQRAGSRRLPGAEFIRGVPMPAGTRLGEGVG